MHEVSVASSILDLIERQLGAPQPLAQVELRIGPLSGVSPDSLLFCFATVARERGFGEPVLSVERTLVDISCQTCGIRYRVPDPIEPCPACGSWKRAILAGDELQLLSATLCEETTHV